MKMLKKKIKYFETTAKYVKRMNKTREKSISLLLKMSDANEIAAAVHRGFLCLGFTLNI